MPATTARSPRAARGTSRRATAPAWTASPGWSDSSEAGVQTRCWGCGSSPASCEACRPSGGTLCPPWPTPCPKSMPGTVRPTCRPGSMSPLSRCSPCRGHCPGTRSQLRSGRTVAAASASPLAQAPSLALARPLASAPPATSAPPPVPALAPVQGWPAQKYQKRLQAPMRLPLGRQGCWLHRYWHQQKPSRLQGLSALSHRRRRWRRRQCPRCRCGVASVQRGTGCQCPRSGSRGDGQT
mmetsp:Transcript_51336/g.164372  ORF Transcript_51336/g.164372 Transcript_51336/m.164372 type:complete len:239 (+) Transcript_51336:776-1492(+)